MANIGTKERPLTVAIIGAGPSGFYAAEALLKTPNLNVRIDIFDRLPTPYGLVRGGVAPDHQKIKSVTAVYEKIALSAQVRFFGNIKIGHDIKVEDLRLRYDQIVYAVGCESDRRMGIPGEDLKGSHSATEFVGWYNGHPDHQHHQFDLSCTAAAVVGVGNVAMDVTRLLACEAEHLSKTDINAKAHEALRLSSIKTIWLLGRRGPAEAAYSPAEIEEIGELQNCDLIVDPEESKVGEISQAALTDAAVKKKVEYVQKQATLKLGSKPRKVILRFLLSPVEVIGDKGRVKALKIEKNKLVPDNRGGAKAVGTGSFETIPVGLVLRSVGYHGIPLPGVPFDEKIGHIPNESGRIMKEGKPVTGEYVVGWAKRGPSGLIGTNRADSVATVKEMLVDVEKGVVTGQGVIPNAESTPELLMSRSLKPVSFVQWKEIDKLEISRGAKLGKIREKFTSSVEMLTALQSPR